jgi:hypothetical protein
MELDAADLFYRDFVLLLEQGDNLLPQLFTLAAARDRQ